MCSYCDQCRKSMEGFTDDDGQDWCPKCSIDMEHVNLCGTIYDTHGYRKCPKCGHIDKCHCGKSPKAHKNIRKRLRKEVEPLGLIERTDAKYE